MARPESIGTILKRRKLLYSTLDISKRLAEEAKEKAVTDPKYFTEYLTIDIFNEMMLSKDDTVRHKAAKDMLAFTLSKKRPAGMGGGSGKEGEEKPKFSPVIPPRKEQGEIPQDVAAKIHSIKTGNSQK